MPCDWAPHGESAAGIILLRFSHGSFARFFNSANARPARRPSLVAVESSCSAWSVRPASNAVNQRRKRASRFDGSLAMASGDFFDFHVAQYSTAETWLSDGQDEHAPKHLARERNRNTGVLRHLPCQRACGGQQLARCMNRAEPAAAASRRPTYRPCTGV